MGELRAEGAEASAGEVGAAEAASFKPTSHWAQTVSRISCSHVEHLLMRICASVRSDISSTPAMCISFPHRHSGPSVQSGANSRSNEDMPILTTNGTSLHRMHDVCSTSLTFRHRWPFGFRIKRRELNWAATAQKRKVPTPGGGRDLKSHNPDLEFERRQDIELELRR